VSRDQANILWIGLLLAVLYLFTDANIRNMIFGRGSSKPKVTTSSFNLTSPSTSSGTGTVVTSANSVGSVSTANVTLAQALANNFDPPPGSSSNAVAQYLNLFENYHGSSA
jgi:hypothetical protein